MLMKNKERKKSWPHLAPPGLIWWPGFLSANDIPHWHTWRTRASGSPSLCSTERENDSTTIIRATLLKSACGGLNVDAISDVLRFRPYFWRTWSHFHRAALQAEAPEGLPPLKSCCVSHTQRTGAVSSCSHSLPASIWQSVCVCSMPIMSHIRQLRTKLVLDGLSILDAVSIFIYVSGPEL